LSYKIFIQNQVWSSEILESEKFIAEFKNSGSVDLQNPFLISVIQNGGYVVKDSFKIGIIIDFVQREPGFSCIPPSASVLFQDSSATFSFGKPENLQFSFGLPESSHHRTVTSRTKPLGHPSGLSSPWDNSPHFSFGTSTPQPISPTTTTTTSVTTTVPRVASTVPRVASTAPRVGPSWPTFQIMGGGSQVGGTNSHVTTNNGGPGTGSSFLQENYTGVFL